jgi:hypothetical protein
MEVASNDDWGYCVDERRASFNNNDPIALIAYGKLNLIALANNGLGLSGG